MQILILTHHRLHSTFNGATTRIRSLATELIRLENKVEILSLISPRYQATSVHSRGEAVHIAEFRNPLQWCDAISRYLNLPPYSLTAHLNSFFLLPRAFQKRSFDIVISESPFLWKIAKKISAPLKVLSAHNHEFSYHNHFSRGARKFLKWIEETACLEANLVVTVSDEDKKHFLRIHPSQKVVTIPNGFRKQFSQLIISSDRKRELKKKYGFCSKNRTALFLASSSFHNTQALLALQQSIEQTPVPNWDFIIVGGCRPPFASPPNFHFLGPQKSLSDFFELSDLGLNPILEGSGSNLKLIDYLGNGLPVLSTAFGMRGYPFRLKGVQLARIGDFAACLNHQKSWELPDPLQIANYEWKHLGNLYAQTLTSALKKELSSK